MACRKLSPANSRWGDIKPVCASIIETYKMQFDKKGMEKFQVDPEHAMSMCYHTWMGHYEGHSLLDMDTHLAMTLHGIPWYSTQPTMNVLAIAKVRTGSFRDALYALEDYARGLGIQVITQDVAGTDREEALATLLRRYGYMRAGGSWLKAIT